MDGKKKRSRGKEEKKAAARPVRQAGSAAGATPSPARAVRKVALTLPDAAAAAAPPPPVDDDDEPVAAAEESGAVAAGAVEEDEDDDEQVERFYALLANIRALRGLVPPCVADGGGTGVATAKKRLRAAAEPPWRPAFRMEDFEEPAAPAPAKRKQRAEDGGESPAAVVATSPSVRHAAVRVDSGSNKD